MMLIYVLFLIFFGAFNIMKPLSFLLVFLSICFTSHAQNVKRNNFLMNLGYTWGGEDLASVQVLGGANSTETIRSGDGFLISLGLDHRFNETWGAQATLGYHFDTVTATNGEMSFEKVPLELLGTYRIESHKFGLGLSHHLNPELSLEVNGANFTADFKNTLGLTAEYTKFFDKFYIGGKFTAIKYQPKAFSLDVKGNQFGLIMGVVL